MAAHQFQAQSTTDLTTVQAKLDDAETELIRLSRQAPQAALRIELDKPEEGDAELVDRLAVVRANVERLRLAKDAAEQAEIARRQDRLLKDDESRRRATSQHLSRAVSSLDRCSSALDVALRSFDDARQGFAAARASAPADLRAGDGYVLSAFSDYELSKLFIAEIGRLCESKDIASPMWKIGFLDWARNGRGVLHGMHEIVADRIARIRSDLASGAERLRHRMSSAAASSPSAGSAATGVVARPPSTLSPEA